MDIWDNKKDNYSGLDVGWMFRLIECDNKTEVYPCIENFKGLAKKSQQIGCNQIIMRRSKCILNV